MRSLGPVLALSFLWLTTGCERRPDPTDTPTARASVAVTAATTSVREPAAAVPAASVPATAAASAPGRKRGPRGIKQVSTELSKRCGPKKDAENNLEMKMQMSESLDCMRRKMNADLDEVLLPLKKSDPARFKALMSEQATWNRALEVSCRAEEELAWLNFDDGSRDDGTARGYAYMGCLDTAITERVLYARAMGASDAAALARRIDEVQPRGSKVKAHLADRKKAAVRWVMTPPGKSEFGAPADWKAFAADLDTIEKNDAELARSTCAGWADLARALGGEEACRKKAELYYVLQGNGDPSER
ncbi:MAG: hypothetical protein EOO75_09410 [Myxococcales bacterium]|nr:MAG: hypothetical protein EOO75_09410 [Myxococcales bacterium]